MAFSRNKPRCLLKIREKHNGSEMKFSQSGIDTNITEESWKKMFENLKIFVDAEMN
jgi:hypothetical protein